MNRSTFNKKLDAILQLKQFEKVTKKRENEMNPILKEEDRIVKKLKLLLENGKIDEALFKKRKPVGAGPARLYGLAKVHTNTVPVRPVLSMPNSAYFKIANQVTSWLSVVDECKINCSTEQVSNTVKKVTLVKTRS